MAGSPQGPKLTMVGSMCSDYDAFVVITYSLHLIETQNPNILTTFMTTYFPEYLNLDLQMGN